MIAPSSIDIWLAAPVLCSREEFFEPLLVEGPALDVGCVDDRKAERIAASLHAWLRDRVQGICGVDRDPRAVEIARSRGFDVRLADAERDELGGPYHLIVAGEVIEHVSNAGCFLENLRAHLAHGGRILLSTPNPFSARQFLKILRHGRPQVHSRHTSWLDPSTLAEILRRARLEVQSAAWIRPPRRGIARLLGHVRRYWNEGLAMELRRATSD